MYHFKNYSLNMLVAFYHTGNGGSAGHGSSTVLAKVATVKSKIMVEKQLILNSVCYKRTFF